MGQSACDEVGDGDQMTGGAVAPGFGLGGLDERVGRFDPGVGELGVEGVEDSLPVLLEGGGDLLDRLQAAAPGPAVPALEQRCGLGWGGGGAEDRAQGLLDAIGAVGLQIQRLDVSEAQDLLAAPGVVVFQPEVAGPSQPGLVFDPALLRCPPCVRLQSVWLRRAT